MGRYQQATIVREYENAAISSTTDACPVFQLMLSVVAKIRPHTVIMWKADSLGHDKYVLTMAKKIIRRRPRNTPAAENIPTSCPESMLIESRINTMTKYYSWQALQNIRRGMNYNAEHALYNRQKLFGHGVNRATKKYM